eukprot:403372123
MQHVRNANARDANGLRIMNLVCLLVYFVLFILTAIFNGLVELYLVIFIASIIFCFLNLAYIFAPSLQTQISAHRILLVYIPAGIIDILAIVEFFRLFINWMRYISELAAYILTLLLALFFLISVFMFSSIFASYVRKTATTTQ